MDGSFDMPPAARARLRILVGDRATGAEATSARRIDGALWLTDQRASLRLRSALLSAGCYAFEGRAVSLNAAPSAGSGIGQPSVRKKRGGLCQARWHHRL